MRVLSRLGKKKGLSNIVAYVLLISITISLSVLVYGWLRFYVSEDSVDVCSDNVNVIIRSYECFLPKDGAGGRIIVTLKNKGLFTVDGFEVRVHNRPGADFGFYSFENPRGASADVSINPGEEIVRTYWFVDNLQPDEKGNVNVLLEKVTLLEVQPFVEEGGEIRCKSYASQEVECN